MQAPAFITQTIVSMLAILCLPRQFHVMVVENAEYRDFNTARWAMPAYLIIASAFVLPIAAAGLLNAGGEGVNPDMLTLTLPIMEEQRWLAILAFLGGAPLPPPWSSSVQ